MKVNVMTFNTECCRGYYSRQFEYDMMADAIKKCDSDIVGLNEMRGQGSRDDFEEQVKIVAEKAGYPYYYFAKAIELYGDNPYGNGLISKYPIVSAATMYSCSRKERICPRTSLAVPGQEINVK